MLADEMIVVGVDDLGGMTVSVVNNRTSSELGQIFLPCPSHGYGGHELVVSPHGLYLALFLYSGQSEVGYELFALQPTLQHLGGLPYVFGEGEAPVFSADDRWLAMMWETYNDWSSDDTNVRLKSRTDHRLGRVGSARDSAW